MKIRSMKVKGFRSLRDFTVGSLEPVSVFYGANNSGKSNVLAVLEEIFRAKQAPQADGVGWIPTPFYYGSLEGCGDNFTIGNKGEIEFVVQLRLKSSELTDIAAMGPLLAHTSLGEGHEHRLELEGNIARRAGDSGATMSLHNAQLNGKVVYSKQADVETFFPEVDDDGIGEADRQTAAEALLNSLTGLVSVVACERHLSAEPTGRSSALSPQTFKRWLHGLSLDRDRFETYARIAREFRAPPFGFGEIGFAEDESILEIMVTDGLGQRLPLARLGTGVQQVLYLIATIANSDARIAAIEEVEINLSFTNQDRVMNMLKSITSGEHPQLGQVLLTSHSDHVGTRADVRRLMVEMTSGATTARPFDAKDRQRMFPRGRRWLDAPPLDEP